MKYVKITNAEVTTWYNSSDVVRKRETAKGFILNWNIKTRVNDRVGNSPMIFEKCSIWVSDASKADEMEKVIKVGNLLTIEGSEEKNKYTDKSGNTKWGSQIKVREFTPITEDPNVTKETKNPDEDLPF